MAKQKMVIKVKMTCEKCRKKAMKIATNETGVASVGVEGSDLDRLVVIGERVDCTSMITKLRKKAAWADIISVEEVRERTTPVNPPNANQTNDRPINIIPNHHWHYYPPPYRY